MRKSGLIASGLGEENIITMCLIFLCAGGFSGAVTAAGGVDSTVALGRFADPGKICYCGALCDRLFYLRFYGTSMGTIAALAPIAVGISEATEFSMAVCVAAVVCGRNVRG